MGRNNIEGQSVVQSKASHFAEMSNATRNSYTFPEKKAYLQKVYILYSLYLHMIRILYIIELSQKTQT